MSATAMIASQSENLQSGTQPQTAGVGRRVRRALFFAGNVGLMMGATLGLLQIYPELLSAWLPFPANASGIALAGIALIGLVEGAVVGLALQGTTGLLRFGAAMFVMIACLITSEIVRSIGLHISLREALVAASSNLMAAQIALGAVGVLIGIRSGRVAQPETASRSVPAARSRRGRANSSRVEQATLAEAAPGGAAQATQIVSPAPLPKPKTSKGWSFRRRVHLGRQKTSVCPYCLDEVRSHDPRGRVVCKICGTPHHADCWAITGKCEVPHLQT